MRHTGECYGNLLMENLAGENVKNMCGICGFYSRREIGLENLIQMNKTMVHRGPDDHGEEIYEIRHAYSVGLAHRRLSIMDLSSLGHQPMVSGNGSVSVVFNGEIYNFLELREELREYTFLSNCDTEVILAAYLKWGISCIDRFNGMFAIAIFDRENDILYLVRDRIGKKPLYYYLESGNLSFASELKPLMEMRGFKKDIETDILGNYMNHWCIPAPYSIFKNVYKLEPGCILRFQYGNVTTSRYWGVNEKYHEFVKNPVLDFETAKDGLKNKLLDAVKIRMKADVPVGIFLSGGYDSSLVCAMAQSVSTQPVKTYCIGFEQADFNEAPFAKRVAEHLETDHTELYISDADMYKMVEELPHCYDEPFADTSQIATMLVSKLAKQDVSVVLTGDGGDEFFGGYNVYSKLQRAQKIDWIGAMIYYAKKIPLVDKKCFKNMSLLLRMVSDERNREIKTQIGINSYICAIDRMLLNNEKGSCYFPFESKYAVKEWDIRRMLLDMETYLPNEILCKVDRASMKYSLECRCPILDKNVMEYSYCLPQNMKDDNGNQKKILKSIVHDYIPRELMERPKMGFGVPIDNWLMNQLREQLGDYIDSSYLKRQGIFDVENTRQFVLSYLDNGDKGKDSGANYSKIVWPFFVFQQWYEKYIA